MLLEVRLEGSKRLESLVRGVLTVRLVVALIPEFGVAELCHVCATCTALVKWVPQHEKAGGFVCRLVSALCRPN